MSCSGKHKLICVRAFEDKVLGGGGDTCRMIGNWKRRVG